MTASPWSALLAEAGDAADSFELLEVGDYDVFVEEVKVGFTNNDNKKFALTLVVESGPHAKRKLWKDLVVAGTEGGLKMFFRQMAALTLDAKFFASEPSDDAIVAALIGKRASAKVIKETWNEQERNKVSFLNRPKGQAPAGVGPGAAAGPAGAPPVSAPRVAAPAFSAPDGAVLSSTGPGVPRPAGAPPVSAPAPAAAPAPTVAAPPAPAPAVTTPAAPAVEDAPAPADPWENATPPAMSGLGDDPF